jgi:hypothetical protein
MLQAKLEIFKEFASDRIEKIPVVYNTSVADECSPLQE